MSSSETFNMRESNDTSSSSSSAQNSPWHSPVPYLFGGLAAMLGLIAFALLILACSYWKLSGYLEDNGEQSQTGRNRDLESGEEGKSEKTKISPPVMEEKFLVIMAGEFEPTHLATPVMGLCSSNRVLDGSSSFGEMNKTCTCVDEEKKEEEGRDNQAQSGSASNRENSD